MKLKPNHVKGTLKQEGTCFGTMLSILKSPLSISMCAAAGWDYVILDTEHNDFNIQSLANCSLVAKYEKLTLLVRLPAIQNHQMVQTLDTGAEGLVLPQVKTVKKLNK